MLYSYTKSSHSYVTLHDTRTFTFTTDNMLQNLIKFYLMKK